MCYIVRIWRVSYSIVHRNNIFFGARADILLCAFLGSVQKYYWPGTRGSWSLVQGHFWGPWSNIDFSEKRSPLAVTYSYQQFSDIRLLFKDEWSPGGQFISRTCHEIKCFIIKIEVAHWALHLKDQMKWNKVFPFSKVHSVKMTHCVNTFQGSSLEIKCQHI